MNFYKAKTYIFKKRKIRTFSTLKIIIRVRKYRPLILLHKKLLQFDWLKAVVFQLNLKYLHEKITNLLRVVV